MKESLPNKILCQLGWQEGARTAVISIRAEENEGNEVGAKGENLDYSNCHSLGICWPLYHKAARHLKGVIPAFINRDWRGDSRLYGCEGLCPTSYSGVLESRVCVHSVLRVVYTLKLCGLKVTLLKSSRETENGCSGPYLQDASK